MMAKGKDVCLDFFEEFNETYEDFHAEAMLKHDGKTPELRAGDGEPVAGAIDLVFETLFENGGSTLSNDKESMSVENSKACTNDLSSLRETEKIESYKSETNFANSDRIIRNLSCSSKKSRFSFSKTSSKSTVAEAEAETAEQDMEAVKSYSRLPLFRTRSKKDKNVSNFAGLSATRNRGMLRSKSNRTARTVPDEQSCQDDSSRSQASRFEESDSDHSDTSSSVYLDDESSSRSKDGNDVQAISDDTLEIPSMVFNMLHVDESMSEEGSSACLKIIGALTVPQKCEKSSD